MPSSRDGRSKRLQTSGGTSRSSQDLSQDGSVFWLGLEVELDEPLERATLLGVGELPRPLPEMLPRGAERNKSVHAVHEVARRSAKDAIESAQSLQRSALNLSVLTNDFISFSPDVSLQYCQLQNLPIFLPL
jgi:hypothetical protein